MTLWSVRAGWMQADVEASTLSLILERIGGDPASLVVDERTGNLALAVSLSLHAETEAVALRQAHYRVAEATHFKANDIELQICRSLPRRFQPDVARS